MKRRIDVITLAVRDLEKALAFYRDGLGLPSKGIIGAEFKGSDKDPAGAVAFFELKGGLILALYPRVDLTKDSKLPDSPSSSVEFSIGYAVENRNEVDKFLEQARKAGARITDPHQDHTFSRTECRGPNPLSLQPVSMAVRTHCRSRIVSPQEEDLSAY